MVQQNLNEVWGLGVAVGVCCGRHTLNAREHHSPLQEGHKEMAQLLLEHGAAIEAAKNDGTTPLYIGLAMGDDFRAAAEPTSPGGGPCGVRQMSPNTLDTQCRRVTLLGGSSINVVCCK